MDMKKLLFIFLLSPFTLLMAQVPELRNPGAILKTLDKSIINYQVAPLKETLADINSHQPNSFGYYRVQKGNSFEVKKENKKYQKQALEYFDDAEIYLLTKNNPVKARELYTKSLNLEPDFYTAMSGIGSTYDAEKNYAEAITWHKKAIQKNYIYSYSHRLLARSYKNKGMLQEAVKEITIALVLDRRHHSLIREWKEIYQAAKLNAVDWTFTPQIRITTTSDKKVLIESKEAWLSYALAKAAWQYEPGFKEAAGVTAAQGITFIEEFECIYNLTMGLAKTPESEKTAPLKALEEAVNANLVNEFIFFEIVFMKNPLLAFQLPDRDIDKIADYVIRVRGKMPSTGP
jgi:tetratricopeptide (TPR) repeat protein